MKTLLVDKEINKANRLKHHQNYVLYRDKRNLTDAEVARRANVDPSAISDWRRGISEPKIEKLLSICKVLKIGVARIYE